MKILNNKLKILKLSIILLISITIIIILNSNIKLFQSDDYIFLKIFQKTNNENKIDYNKKESEENQSCFDAQVGALLSMDELVKLPIEAVHVDEASLDNIILDTCRENEAVMDFAENVFRGIPCLSQSAELS